MYVDQIWLDAWVELIQKTMFQDFAKKLARKFMRKSSYDEIHKISPRGSERNKTDNKNFRQKLELQMEMLEVVILLRKLEEFLKKSFKFYPHKPDQIKKQLVYDAQHCL